MAAVVAIPRLGAGAILEKQKFDRRNLVRANRAALTQQPPFQGVSARSKLLLAKPYNKSARRIIVIKTEDLVKKQEVAHKTLLREFKKDKSDLAAQDMPSRETILRNTEALSKRQRRQLRFRNKILKERKRLYKRDPSSQRAVDLDLSLSKFKKHFGANLEDREPTAKAGGGGDDDDTLSPGSVTGRDGGNEVCTKMDHSLEELGPAKVGSSDGANDAPPSTNSKDDDECPIPNMDGAFDDHIRAQTKKRKLFNSPADLESEKEQRKKAKKDKRAKKEQARKDKPQTATSASESQSLQPNRSIRDQDVESTKNNAAFDSMSQSNKSEAKVIRNNETAVKYQNGATNESRVNGARINGTTSKRRAVNGDETNGDKVNTARTNGVKIDVHPTKSVVSNGTIANKPNPSTDIGLAAQPWYKIHARRIMEPDFDDLVYERPRKPKHKPANNGHNPYLVHGAILDCFEDEEAVSGALPSPPASSSPPCSNKLEKVDEFREEPEPKKVDKHSTIKKKQAAKSCSRPHSSPVSAGAP